jgi:primosomal replication protein N
MYQQLTIIGRLGADPELRYTPTGTAVCSFNVATDRTWNNDQGQKQTETTWHRVTVWRKHAEVCAQYLSKGKMVLVTGSVKAQWFHQSRWAMAPTRTRSPIQRLMRDIIYRGFGLWQKRQRLQRHLPSLSPGQPLLPLERNRLRPVAGRPTTAATLPFMRERVWLPLVGDLD